MEAGAMSGAMLIQ